MKPEYENATVRKTLDIGIRTSSPISESAENEIALLERRLSELFAGQTIRIADIGCGDGRHALRFARGIEAANLQCKKYVGFEISSAMVEQARKRVAEARLEHVAIVEGNALTADLVEAPYHVAWCLFFTAGNLRDLGLPLEAYDDAYLDKNPAFSGVVRRFYESLVPGGRLFFTIYKDVPLAEQAQHTVYEQCGMTVITRPGNRFVATNEGFWSVRWTRESVLSNLSESRIPPE
ncbi:MAG TPA: class I SAM-dependent methyltransferase, partial [Polyangiaceae bacterium]|nr:class I SAM-dependent methyltransferase [Polyangiaceae bacterium]